MWNFPSSLYHPCSCAIICVFNPVFIPLTHQRWNSFHVQEGITGRESRMSWAPSACPHQSGLAIHKGHLLYLPGVCSKTPGDLWQKHSSPAVWHLSQCFGIYVPGCEQHAGRGQTCQPDPSAPPVSDARVLNRGSAKCSSPKMRLWIPSWLWLSSIRTETLTHGLLLAAYGLHASNTTLNGPNHWLQTSYLWSLHADKWEN